MSKEMTSLRALEIVKGYAGGTYEIEVIENELRALEIIKKHFVLTESDLRYDEELKKYLFCDAPISKEEFDLLKEVL